MLSYADLLIKADRHCDYAIGVSTISNSVNLFLKFIFIFIDNQTIANNHYFTYVKKKSTLRCVILLIPGLGNIVVGLFDFATGNKRFMLHIVRINGLWFRFASEPLKDDAELMLAAIEQNTNAIRYASNDLRRLVGHIAGTTLIVAAYQNRGIPINPQDITQIQNSVEQLQVERGNLIDRAFPA